MERGDMRLGHTIAESYERYFVPVIAEPLARDLLGQVRPRAGERALDVACGTGIVARLAAGMVGAAGSVTGIDINPGMLDVAKGVSSDLSPTIEWMESDAEELPFPAESFDLVTCQLSLQFIGNKPVAIKEMHRVLKKSGRVGIALPGRAGEVFGIFSAVPLWLARFRSPLKTRDRRLSETSWSDGRNSRQME